MAAGAKLNRIVSATWNSITFATVLDVSDNYPPTFNQTKGGGSLATMSALRNLDGEVTITYQGWQATRIPSGGTVASLVVVISDQDGTNVTTTYPFMMAAGPAFQMPNSDFGTFVQKFIVNAPLGTAQADMLPTTA